MNKFKVGDKVNVYSYPYGRETGEINKIETQNGQATVSVKGGMKLVVVYPQQLRRLIPKPPKKTFWLCGPTPNALIRCYTSKHCKKCTEFKEVTGVKNKTR